MQHIQQNKYNAHWKAIAEIPHIASEHCNLDTCSKMLDLYYWSSEVDHFEVEILEANAHFDDKNIIELKFIQSEFWFTICEVTSQLTQNSKVSLK